MAAPMVRARLAALLSGVWAATQGGVGSPNYSKAGEDWEALCRSNMQSPIDVDPDHVANGHVQARVLYRPWSLEDIKIAESFGKVPRLEFKRSPGLLLLGTRYGDFDEYELTAVEVHAPSEHTFRHATWPVELQLWHRPVPLLRISELKEHIVELGQKSEAFDEKLQEVAEADKRLLQELNGVSSPWESAVGRADSDSVKETLDWMDASKKGLEAQASKLREHTFGQLKDAEALSREVDRLVMAQERELANHHVVISLFVRRAADLSHSNSSSHKIVEWVTEALTRGGVEAGREAEAGPLDVRQLLAETAGRRPLISYPGSLNRPPCTPNVRWLLTDRPIAARVEHIEDLIRATLLRDPNGGFLDDGIIGDARETQSSERRKLERVMLFDADFEEPVIVEEDLLAADKQKWIRIERYSKLFCVSSLAILCTPCLFILTRACGFSEPEPQDGLDAE